MTHVSPQFDSTYTRYTQRRFRQAARAMPWVWGSLIGSGLLGLVADSTAWAGPLLNDSSHLLVAQQVVDGLPPPPPTFGQDASSVSQAQQYLVVVNGDSQDLLSQIQQIQPAASVQEYNGQRFIQAGLFNDVTTAQQQVSTLAASGINAQLVAVTGTSASLVSQAPAGYDTNPGTGTLPPPEVFPSTPVTPGEMPPPSGEVEFGSPASTPPVSEEGRSGSSRSYYVIIPGGGKDLDGIVSQISRLTSGMGIDNMVQAGTSKGAHVRVGPFNSRGAASRWSRYFRDFGLDARVGYGR